MQVKNTLAINDIGFRSDFGVWEFVGGVFPCLKTGVSGVCEDKRNKNSGLCISTMSSS